jgi:hypothetical protein
MVIQNVKKNVQWQNWLSPPKLYVAIDYNILVEIYIETFRMLIMGRYACREFWKVSVHLCQFSMGEKICEVCACAVEKWSARGGGRGHVFVDSSTHSINTNDCRRHVQNAPGSLHSSAIKRPSKSEGETAAAGAAARVTLAFFSGITHTYKGEIIWPIAPHANSKQLPPSACPFPAENKSSREKRTRRFFLSLLLPALAGLMMRKGLRCYLNSHTHSLLLTPANLLDSTLNARELCLPPDELPLSLSLSLLGLAAICGLVLEWVCSAGLEARAGGLRKSAVCGKRRVALTLLCSRILLSESMNRRAARTLRIKTDCL